MKHRWEFTFEEPDGKFIKYKHYECKKCEAEKTISIFTYHNNRTQTISEYSRHNIELGLFEPICQKVR